MLSQNGLDSLATFKTCLECTFLSSALTWQKKASLKERRQPSFVENTPFYYAPGVIEKPDIRNTDVQHLEVERKQESRADLAIPGSQHARKRGWERRTGEECRS